MEYCLSLTNIYKVDLLINLFLRKYLKM